MSRTKALTPSSALVGKLATPLYTVAPELIPVKAEPSIAGNVPVRLAAGIFPVPVILLLFKSRSPPSCGELSFTSSPDKFETVEKDRFPLPSVFKNWPAEPSEVG